MPSLARAYIAMIAVLASAVLVVVTFRWNPHNLGEFAVLIALALLASAMKICLPGLLIPHMRFENFFCGAQSLA